MATRRSRGTRRSFPIRRLVADLKAEDSALTIVDAHIKKQAGMPQYDSGLSANHFAHNPDGSVYEGPVWPSNAEKNPGPSVFPDFSKPAARQWWGTLFKPLVDVGVAGIWNDMNEPAVFNNATGTMPLDVKFDNEGQPSDHREIHNVYGLLMTRGTYEGLKALARTSGLSCSRARHAGGQRYAAQWPGDNVSDWTAMRGAIPTLLGMGLSGLSFVGVDVGGFAEAPPPELYTRWLQSGLLYPFYRTHTAFGTPDQEPWSYGVQWEAYNRRAIEMRYERCPKSTTSCTTRR
jgi:alpha-glucosidase